MAAIPVWLLSHCPRTGSTPSRSPHRFRPGPLERARRGCDRRCEVLAVEHGDATPNRTYPGRSSSRRSSRFLLVSAVTHARGCHRTGLASQRGRIRASRCSATRGDAHCRGKPQPARRIARTVRVRRGRGSSWGPFSCPLGALRDRSRARMPRRASVAHARRRLRGRTSGIAGSWVQGAQGSPHARDLENPTGYTE